MCCLLRKSNSPLLWQVFFSARSHAEILDDAFHAAEFGKYSLFSCSRAELKPRAPPRVTAKQTCMEREQLAALSKVIICIWLQVPFLYTALLGIAYRSSLWFRSQPISLPSPLVPLSIMHFLRESDRPANGIKDAGRIGYLWSWDTASSANL
jgi:hypothetical protein